MIDQNLDVLKLLHDLTRYQEMGVAWAETHWPYLAGGVAGLIGLSAWIGYLRRAKEDPTMTGHGSAAWATKKAIQQSPLWHAKGIVLGYYQGHRLEAPAGTNVLVAGPAESGKTTTIFEPTIRDYPGSVVCMDLKGRLTHTTRQAREELGPVYVWNPRARDGEHTDHLNPHDLIRWGRHEVPDVQSYTEMRTHMDREEPSDKGSYFRDGAISAHTAGVIYNHYRREEKDSPHGMLRFFRSPHESIDAKLQRMAEFTHPDDPRNDVVQSWAGSVRQLKRSEDRKQLWDTPLRWLKAYDDPDLAEVTDDTTIDLAAFQQSPHPATLYLRVSASDVTGRLRRDVRLMLTQFVMHMEDRAAHVFHYPVLFPLDDVAELGDFDLIKHIGAYLREYGGWLLLGAQSFGQLWETFGRNSGLYDNLTTWVLFRPSYPETAELISKALGSMTVVQPVTRTTTGAGRRTVSDGVHTYKRRLVDDWEVMHMGPKQMIVRYKELQMLVDRGD